MRPKGGKPVKQEDVGGDVKDTAGEHGEMDVRGAKRLGEKEEET